MRLHIFTCLMVIVPAIGLALPPLDPTNINPAPTEAKFEHSRSDKAAFFKKAVLTLAIDSIHQINCLRATGYLRVLAAGGVPAYTYDWSNGNTGNLATSLVAGTYTIIVTDGSSATASLTVTISEDFVMPDADAGADFSATCSNSVLSLSGSGSIGANFNYLWTVSNGGVIQSGATTLSPVIKHTGDFTLTVTNNINGCTKSSTVHVAAANEPPSPVTATGGTFNCILPVTLNSTFPALNTSYKWTGPAGYMSTLLHPQVSIVGTFVFKVTDTLTTCFNTANAIVVADTSKPVALPIGGEINCSQPTRTITGTYAPVGITYAWTGPGGFTSTLANPVVGQAGVYQVIVTNPTNGCTKSNTATITANFAPPTALATVSGSLTCTIVAVQLTGNGTPAGITYSWAGPLGFTSAIQNPFALRPGVYVLTTRNPVNGCTATASVTVLQDITAPGASATGGLKTCANPTVALQSTSPTQGVSFQWAGPNGYVSTLQNPIVVVAGIYTVTIRNPVNGCTSTASATVTQNVTPPSLTATSATVSCYTPNPHVVATSQTSGVTFVWVGPNGFSSNISNPVVTVGGTYTVTATNPVNGCTTSRIIFVDENLATPVVFAGEDRVLNCNFTSILANPIGSSTGNNITYLWTTWDGNIFSGATSLYARFDAVGHYTLTVKNTQSGCMVMDSMEVTQTPELTLSAVQLTSVSCNGGSNGSVRATPVGGALPFSYIWSNGSQTATVNNLSAGIYSVTVTDSEGCIATSSATVTQPGVLQLNVSATNQTQFGVNNGSAVASPTGGSSPYMAIWSTGSTFLAILNLAPGTYTVTITDNKGCTKSATANVNALSCTISGTVSTTNLSCAGTSTGTATASITGTPTPIVFLWSNGTTTSTASNLAAGNYSVTATGANGCFTVLTTQITGPQPLLLAVVSNTGVTCSGQINGSATMNASGGTAPYSYLWSNSQNTATLTGVGVGTYTCTTTDAQGCTMVQSTQISGPQPVVLSLLSKVDVACFDGLTGVITMSTTGGTAPYSYSWSNSATGASISGLAVGSYTCTVTDANGCSKNLSAQIVATDNTGPQLILKNASIPLNAGGMASVTPAMFDNGSFDQTCGIVNWTVSPSTFNCNQLGTNTVTLTATDRNGNSATGTALLSVVDNIPPVLTCPSNQSAPACSSIVFFNVPEIQDNCFSSGTATLTVGLPSGTAFPLGVTQQQFSFSDAGGNQATCQFTVTVTGGINVTASATPTSCSGNCDGSATIAVVGGGTPPSVLWSTGQTGLFAGGLCAGSYFATLTDGMGCAQTVAVQVQVLDMQAPSLFCPNDIVAGYCNPVVNYTQPQVLDNCSVNLSQLQLVVGLPSGFSFPIGLTTQLFRYTDGGGNVGECTFNVTIHLAASVNSSHSNASCAGACDGTASISVSGGQGPFGILWSNGSAGPDIANLCAGMYTATVADGNGCQQVQNIQIGQPSPIVLTNSNVTNDVMHTGVGSITVSLNGGSPPYSFAWTKDGLAYSTSQNLFGLFTGDYALVVTDAHGCTFSTPTFQVTSSVATNEPEDAFQWQLYPNPATSEVFIKMNGAEAQNARVSIFDASGRLLLEREINAATSAIDLSGIAAGILLVRVTNELGSFSKMVMKE